MCSSGQLILVHGHLRRLRGRLQWHRLLRLKCNMAASTDLQGFTKLGIPKQRHTTKETNCQGDEAGEKKKIARARGTQEICVRSWPPPGRP